jgi:tRNA threonylcarbamoyl adenosine modification protein YjeE
MKNFYHSQSAEETEALAKQLSLWAKPGLVINLQGDLGAGKSTFARAFIKALAKANDEFDIPSPSFSLIQQYDNTRLPVAHVDLYRLEKESEIEELGLVEILNTHFVLVEWPERLPSPLSPHCLTIQIAGAAEVREIKIEARGHWQALLNRDTEIEDFLASTMWANIPRAFFEGDASSRRYEILRKDDRPVILMDMPQRPDGPPVKDGKPYSAIAHLAENISSVIKVNEQLIAHGLSAPKIEACDQSKGLAVIEHLGGKVFGQMMIDGDHMLEPMREAVTVLAAMAQKHWPDNLPHYDIEAQLIEVDLLPAWFWPFINQSQPETKLHQSFAQIWRKILPLTAQEKPHWVLRDYHSPNLIWIADRVGLNRVGLIDTQDAVLGHEAYDLVSMLQDARINIDFTFADELYAYYEKLRQAQGPFDAEKFNCAYAILGAQRATKILGIFARLAKRDGKPAYLKHMPRVSRYLKRNLEHPILHELKAWFDVHLPAAINMDRKI